MTSDTTSTPPNISAAPAILEPPALDSDTFDIKNIQIVSDIDPRELRDFDSGAVSGFKDAYDIIVVGGGPAGITAAIYAARAGKSTLMIEGDYTGGTGEFPGGQLILTSHIENFPGFFPFASGLDLMTKMREQAEALNVEILTARATTFTFDKSNPSGPTHQVHTAENGVFFAKAVILATGAVARKLGVPGEDEHYGSGVSSCATCDGAFFAGKDVAVVGGGDSAVESALYLSEIANKVYMFVRGLKFRTESRDLEILKSRKNVEIIMDSNIVKILGDKSVEGVEYNYQVAPMRAVRYKEIALSAVFTDIGHDPATKSLLRNGEYLLDMRNNGYVRTFNNSPSTSVPFVYAAGDLVDDNYRQAVTAAASGCQAAMVALRDLSSWGG